MARHITKHAELLDAIGRTEIVSELIEEHAGHFKYELDLEVIVYGRNYAGKKVGPYARLLEYEPGETIVEQGDTSGNTFYILVEGALDVFVRDDGDTSNNTGRKVAQLSVGTSFGEMAILAGVPRNASVLAPTDGKAVVLELTRPALRLLRKLPRFAQRLDATYRSHGLGRSLEDVRQMIDGDTAQSFDEELLKELRGMAEFSVFGKNHVLALEGAPIESVMWVKNGWVRRARGTHTDASSTNAVMGMDADDAVDFLGAGTCLGLDGLDALESFDAARKGKANGNGHTNGGNNGNGYHKGVRTWNFTATVMARTEVLEISLDALRDNPRLRASLRRAFSDLSAADDDAGLTTSFDRPTLLATEKEITTGVVDGTNLLVMDMDKCVRCGNCSLACHTMHGNSRLLRRGIHIERPARIKERKTYGNTSAPTLTSSNGSMLQGSHFQVGSVSAAGGTQHVLVPSVCMHCQDPECLTGCPTGAIGWKPSGEIDINPPTCIGCGDCATQCPYNAISMVPRSPAKKKEDKDAKPPTAWQLFANRAGNFLRVAPKPIPAPVTETENLLAVKCNLCHDTPLNPANRKSDRYSCQESCPTGALVRVNPRSYFDEVGRTLGVKYRDSTHAIGRNIHKRDTPAQMWHIGGALTTLALTLLTIWGLIAYGFDTSLVARDSLFSWLTMRWLTGIVGLVGIAAVMTYPFRKKVYRRRAGALRYWMLFHVYAGTIAGIILLMHGGTRTGGLLTTLLMLAFDLVILSGLFGIASYIIAPRIMTSIEGEPLLIEDLKARRAELRQTLQDVLANSTAQVRDIVTRHVQRRIFTLPYLLRHYLRREELSLMLARAREDFEPQRETLKTPVERAALNEAVEAAVTLRRADALIYLHGVLKIWIAPHVVSTSAMLALMIVHIIQVVFFRVG